MVCIYGLTDPRTGEVRYVGKANSAESRLRSHLRDSRRRTTPVYRWINKLASLGLVPGISVLAECRAKEWPEVERRIIAQHRPSGRLLNVADGGDEPYCSPEVRAANGRKVAERTHGDEAAKRLWSLKRNLSQAIREGYLSNHARERLRQAAARCPELLGCFAGIEDRIEAVNGCASG